MYTPQEQPPSAASDAAAYTAGVRQIDTTSPITTSALMYPSGAPSPHYGQLSDVSFDFAALIVPALAFFAGYMVAKHF